MEDENLLDDELAGPTNVDSPATFSKKLIRKFGICHGSMGTDAVTHNNNIAKVFPLECFAVYGTG